MSKIIVFSLFHRQNFVVPTEHANEINYIGPIYTRDGSLGRAWAKNDSSSDNPSVYKYGQADGQDHPSRRAIAIIRLVRRIIVDNSSRRMIRHCV